MFLRFWLVSISVFRFILDCVLEISSSLGLTSVYTILRFVRKSSENVKYSSHVINNTTTMTNGTRAPHLTEYNKLNSG